MPALRDAFYSISSNYSREPDVIRACWTEIAEAYSQPSRTYHNPDHLQQMLGQMTLIKHRIRDWDCVIFALMYHDLIYDALAPDNEARSAALAQMRLSELHVPPPLIATCQAMIMATRGHYREDDPDINYFTDSDLAILGAAPNQYAVYSKAVRKEYATVPDEHYYAGRLKVLKHFLDFPEIFKTPEFYDRYEVQARKNIADEMNGLG
jgi:predicted metal-dependent HD superfamily phosphohydrolase